jgi:hypothetical protein
MSTFTELKDQAEKQIRAHIRSMSSDSSHHFVVDSTNYLVEHGAVLLAALRLWGDLGKRPTATFEHFLIRRMQRRWRTLPRSWLKNAILMNFMPASSLKGLLTHLHASCTTP